MRSTRAAVTFGRYSPVTIGHAVAVVEVLQTWTHLSIGVLSIERPKTFRLPRDLKDFYKKCDTKCAHTHNPFSVEERIRMWKATIKRLGLSRQVSVCPLRRPEYFTEAFNSQFPPNEYDLVFPGSLDNTSKFDIDRNVNMGSILGREVYFVNPPLIIHGSRIRRAVSRGCPWDWFVPGGALRVFVDVEGSRRLGKRRSLG